MCTWYYYEHCRTVFTYINKVCLFFIFLQHVLLGLRFSELSWDHSYPEEEGDSHILWLEFDGEEDGTPVNKLLKIYSKQVRKGFDLHFWKVFLQLQRVTHVCVSNCRCFQQVEKLHSHL